MNYRVSIAILAFFLVGVIIFQPQYTGFATEDTTPKFNLELSKQDYTKNAILQGYADLYYPYELDPDTKIMVYIDGAQTKSILLKELVSIENVPAQYKISGNEVSDAPLTFNAPGEQTKYAIVMRKGIEDSIIFTAMMDIEGSNALSPSIDIGDDTKKEWTYLGPFTGNYNTENAIYPPGLKVKTPSANPLWVEIYGVGSNEYCSEITLPPGNKFKFSAFTKLKGSSTSRIGLRLRHTNFVELTDPVTGLILGCEISPTSTPSWQSCVSNFNNPSEQNYMLCIFDGAGNIDSANYQIAALDTGSFNSSHYFTFSGWINALNEYYLRAEPAIYDNILNQKIIYNESSLMTSLKTYLDDSTNCRYSSNQQYTDCIIPLKIKSNSKSSITLKNLQVSYDKYGIGRQTLTKFTPIEFKEDMIKISQTSRFDLSRLNIPASGKTVKLILGNLTSNEKTFNVVEGPEAKIYTRSEFVTLMDKVFFDASNSTTTNNKTLVEYNWDFGEGVTKTGINVEYAFSSMGKKNIKLTVKDSTGLTNTEIMEIQVQSAKENVISLINKNRQYLDISESLFSSSKYLTQVNEIKKYTSELSTVKSSIDQIENKLNSISNSTTGEIEKEQQYRKIRNELIDLQDKVPADVQMDVLVFDNYIDYRDIPTPKELNLQDIKNPDKFKEAVYKSRNDFKIESNVYDINIKFASKKEEKARLVKKTITSSNSAQYIIEIIPKEIAKKIDNIQMITKGTVINSDPIIKYPGDTQEIIYLISTESDLKMLSNLKTLVIPIESSTGLTEVQNVEPICGNDKCEASTFYKFDESDSTDKYYCKEDCESSYLWLIILGIILILGGIFYLNFYKGPYNFNELSKKLSKKREGNYITPKKDLESLAGYIRNSLKKGFTKDQIRSALIIKGWKKINIDEAFDYIEKQDKRINKPEIKKSENKFKEFFNQIKAKFSKKK